MSAHPTSLLTPWVGVVTGQTNLFVLRKSIDINSNNYEKYLRYGQLLLPTAEPTKYSIYPNPTQNLLYEQNKSVVISTKV